MKLIDFGGVAPTPPNGCFLTDRAGTAAYAAPEVLKNESCQGPQQDMWYILLAPGVYEPLYLEQCLGTQFSKPKFKSLDSMEIWMPYYQRTGNQNLNVNSG